MNIGKIPAKWAGIAPRRTALIDIPSGRRVSFGTLARRVRKLANAFVARGIHKGERVAVLAKNSIEYFEIYYACARAGLIVQPLNWRLSASELTRILHDGAPSALIVADEFRAVRAALESTFDLKLWAEFGPGSDGSFDALVDAAPGVGDMNPR